MSTLNSRTKQYCYQLYITDINRYHHLKFFFISFRCCGFQINFKIILVNIFEYEIPNFKSFDIRVNNNECHGDAISLPIQTEPHFVLGSDGTRAKCDYNHMPLGSRGSRDQSFSIGERLLKPRKANTEYTRTDVVVYDTSREPCKLTSAPFYLCSIYAHHPLQFVFSEIHKPRNGGTIQL